MRDAFVTGIATILWGLKWADHADGHRCCNLSGCKIEEYMPGIPEIAWGHAEKIVAAIEAKVGLSWRELFDLAMTADTGETVEHDLRAARRFGECLCYMAQGHGVSWFDDHAEFLVNGKPFSSFNLHGCGTDQAEQELEDYAAESCKEKGTGVRCVSCGAYNDPDRALKCQGCGESVEKYKVTAEYVDTCSSDYLQDSHTREGEWLLYVPLGGQTNDEAVDELMDLMNGEAPPEGFPEEDVLSDDSIRTALLDAIKSVDFRPCDTAGNRLDKPKEEDDEEHDDQAEYDAALENDQSNVYVVLRWTLNV